MHNISSDPKQVSDLDLMQQAAAGNADAFAQVYRRYGGDVLAFLARHRDCRQSGDDLSQEVFLRAWRNARTFRGAAAVKTYLIGIARNVLREAWAAASGHQPPQPRTSPGAADCLCGCSDCRSTSPAEARQCRAQLLDKLARQIDSLPPKLREAFELTLLGQMRVGQAADAAGCSTAALRMRLRRAIAHLAANLEDPAQPLDRTGG